MSEISTVVSIVDKMSQPIKSIGNEADKLAKKMSNIGESTDKAFNGERASDFARRMSDVKNEADGLADSLGGGASQLTGMLTTVGLIGVAFGGLKKIVSEVGQLMKESAQAYEVQLLSELQLEATLKNNVFDSGRVADTIKAKASEIQSRGIIGDEAMIGAGAEFSRYIKNDKAISILMDTLSNFAMGQSGGKEITKEQLVGYAESLGKALNGTFTFLERQNFKISDAQKELIKNGDDITKALTISEVVNASWEGLYETMSNTPQNKITQMNNALGDMKEMIGSSLEPLTESFFNVFENHLPTVNSMVGDLTGTMTELYQSIGLAYEFLDGMVSLDMSGFANSFIESKLKELPEAEYNKMIREGIIDEATGSIRTEAEREAWLQNQREKDFNAKADWYSSYYGSMYKPNENFLDVLKDTKQKSRKSRKRLSLARKI